MVPSVAHLMRRSYGEELQQLRDGLVGRRFLVLRPTSSLVTVRRVGTAGDGLCVTFVADGGGGGGGGEQTKPADWFKANSRPIRG